MDKESELYVATISGDLHQFKTIFNTDPESKGGDEAIVRALVGDVSRNDTEKRNLLIAEDVVLEAIIKAGPKLILMSDSNGRKPLHFAAYLGNLEATHYLLQKCKSNATRRDKRGELPIHLAALEGHHLTLAALHAASVPQNSDSDRKIHEEEYVHANMCKDLDLYLAAKNGDLADIKRIIRRISTGDSGDDILSRLSLIGNTFLHVAAKHGNQDIVKFIASTKPSLVSAKNICGETVLHLAAKGGHEAMVEALVGIISHNETEKSALLMAENEMGNTALDQALISGWEFGNQLQHGESAVYLAAKAGLVECVSSILAQCTDERRLNLLFKNKSSIQAAIERKDIVVLEAIINAKPGLIQMRDNEGRNPLHFAASLGHLKAANYLLQNYPFNATRRDKKGKLPIHLAALEGHVDIICALLQDIPEADDLLDKSGRNILHIAARSGRYKVFNFALKNPNINSPVNMKDKFGDTPLHIACRNDHPKILNCLTWDQKIDFMAVNNKGMTALNVAYEKKACNPSFRQRLVWAALKAVSVPQPISY
ncbi:protein ACCELERATED CELL DEATH 6-like [Salvia hispanica]|uniref:protein ACCELERATED CELL DEATH 6-like n=1 Tax=Salvia hispanica TaxID=49212 RepID=UPI00200925A0|nr:protein ACCELERATED CELL DEATH 6-like [Salvia hispanica]